jgi:hypothetical protein
VASLNRTLRRDLETTVKKARRVAETGAVKAVAQLGVGETEPPKHLSAEQRTLRNRLRAHGRQLGDRRDTKTGIQATARLVQECAYEHWHRMLFARFLAETDLLIEPDSGVAITLDEVQELAREKATDWLQLASDYAERMLPQIFRKDDPVLQIALPPETRSEMEDLLKGLSKSVFEADDSLGWVYQFWQADKKDEVNKSEVKIGADELPAVTQLFTEDYMVLFLLHNTLGAWWAGKVLAANPGLARSAANEAALRTACKVGDVEWTYLRFIRDKAEDSAEGPWRPTAGAFENWSKAAKGVTVLDPCMGSGHFLVFALPILVALRIADEGLSEPAAIDAVLKDNLFGLEIDPRCTQIAAFNLAFAAWRKVGHRPLPRLNLACSGLTIGMAKAEWLRLAEKAVVAADPAAKRDLLGVEKNLLTVGLEERVKNGLEALYDLFAKAPWLGSLIDPRRAGADIFREGFDKLEPLLGSILAAADNEDAVEMVVAAQGMAKAANLLSRRFVLVITNVPYLGRGRQDEVLRDYSGREFDSAKADLATCFVDRSMALCSEGGTASFVTKQEWLFLGKYEPIRSDLLRNCKWGILAILGPRAFEAISGERVTVCLQSIEKTPAPSGHCFFGADVSTEPTATQKAIALEACAMIALPQEAQLNNPDGRIKIQHEVTNGPQISSLADSYQGIVTGDLERFRKLLWEVSKFGDEWVPFRTTVSSAETQDGCHSILLWERGAGQLHRYAAETRDQLHDMHESGNRAWNGRGIAINRMGDLHATVYYGEHFDNNVAVLIPKNYDTFEPLYRFCSSKEFAEEVRKLDRTLKVTNKTLTKIPFELSIRTEPSNRQCNVPCDTASIDPTQWRFRGHPRGSDAPLQVAVIRLLGYRWPRQTGSGFMDCPPTEPDGLEQHADNDGIVCLTAQKGEAPAEQRLNALLADAFGAEWSAAKLASLLAEAGYADKTLDGWLRDGFFAQHCEVFHQRPFIWHIWDGRRDGFHALVNYHRLSVPNGEGRRTLEKLIYSYLGDWIDRQRADQKADIEGADARLAHAEQLKAELIKILEGDPPYDIFVRWKPLHEQPLGWDPGINDGVRMNIRPFMTARTRNARGANTCILRNTPKIKWEKDRGKEPTRDKVDYPWFWGWDESSADFAGGAEFDGNRWNDLHYSRAIRQSARNRQRPAGGKT